MNDSRSLPPPPSLASLLADGPLALFLDFDGTLVEIAPQPDAIQVAEGLADGLERLAGQLSDRLAVVSGRSLADIASHIGTPKIAMAGSHGIERRFADGNPIGDPPQPIPDAARLAMEEFANANEGVRLETKTIGTALHYRNAPDREDAVHAIAERLANQYDLKLKPGKCVVELVRHGTDKAGAVEAFMEQPRFKGAQPVFIGDDLTDEDGFAAVGRHGGFGVLVGARPATRARFSLRDPAQVHEWLGL